MSKQNKRKQLSKAGAKAKEVSLFPENQAFADKELESAREREKQITAD